MNKHSVIGYSLDDKLPSQPEMRQPVRLLPLVDEHGERAIPKELRWAYADKKYRGKDRRIVKYVGAAGDDFLDVDENKIKEMTDPYNSQTRQDFTNCAYSDPTLGPALENRNNSFFENGFDMILELTNKIGEDGRPMDEAAQAEKMKMWSQIFAPHLQKIIDWSQKKDILLLEKMKASHISSIVQGRSLTLVTPPMSILGDGVLPDSLTNLSTDETGNPIIDTVRRKLIAVKLKTRGKKLAVIDEMVYCVRKQWGLRSDAMFFGASAIEPVVQASKGYKRVINFDFPKAGVAGYLTKLLLKATTAEGATISETQLQSIVNNLVSEGTDIIGINEEADITPVQTKVDTPVLELLVRKYEELLLSAGGSTMSQLGRTANLNRDTATIMEISHQKYVRTPDENLISGYWEDQLLQPLLAHLSGVPKDPVTNEPLLELPVRIKIVRRTKVDETQMATQDEDTQITDKRMQDQVSQLSNNEFKQKDVEEISIGS
jgi:hypothetical protein